MHLHRFICPLPQGIHARPASVLEARVRGLGVRVTLRNERSGAQADARSVLDLLAADVRHGDACVVEVDGEGAERGLLELKRFLDQEFPLCDGPAAPPAQSPEEGGLGELPRRLRTVGASLHRGRAAVGGIARGVLLRWGVSEPELSGEPARDPVAEGIRFERALGEVNSLLEAAAAGPAGLETELAKAHRSIARDAALAHEVRRAIETEQLKAVDAVTRAARILGERLRATGNALLAERALDVREVARRLRLALGGPGEAAPQVTLEQPAVVAAESLTPGEFLSLDPAFLRGLVLGEAGMTSHTVILARSRGVPTLVGFVPPAEIADGESVIVDGDSGVFAARLDAATERQYALEHARAVARAERQKRLAGAQVCRADGRVYEIAANLALPVEAEGAFAAGADGVGLFRTEMLFLGRTDAPGEDEQAEAYRQVLQAAGGRPVIIRTLDIGGDKPLPYLQVPAEENPFLGLRGVRLYRHHETLFRTQLRALLKASTLGNLRILIPMVSTLDEVRWVRGLLETERAALRAAGFATAAEIPLGSMVETPAAVFALPELARACDFFSVGSNDLLQYFMAADRANAAVAHLYEPLKPSFLRLLRLAVSQARAAGRWIGLCGEMGGRVELAPVLFALGFDEVSASPSLIPALKAAASALDHAAAEALLESLLAAEDARAARSLLEQTRVRCEVPLLEPQMVVLDADLRSRAEVLQYLAGQLHVHDRTQAPLAVEEALWAREEVYATAFEGGFAVPHCKHPAVVSSTLALVRLREAIQWSEDAEPVRVAILLAMRPDDAGGRHLKTFAALARKLMHEEFRERLLTAADPALVANLLLETLGLQEN